MNKYLEIDLAAHCKSMGCPDSAKLHCEAVHAAYVKEVTTMVSNDEDLAKETLTSAQETAGFEEPPQRLALGGHFNHMLLWSVLRSETEAESEPTGALMEQISKQYTDFEGFKYAFKQAVANRAMPGWVWLGLRNGKDLVICQTNNEDNPLMGGVAEMPCTPILGIDLWEHAYFHTYKGDKAAYCADFLARVNWAKVSASFETHNMKSQVADLL